jgi:hypothetical protein
MFKDLKKGYPESGKLISLFALLIAIGALLRKLNFLILSCSIFKFLTVYSKTELMRSIASFFLVLTILCTGCIPEKNNNKEIINVQGFSPIYLQPGQVEEIKSLVVQPTVNDGKIYAYQNYIFQNEQYKGFHIIDNSNPANATKIGFLNIPLSTEISIKGNYLYTNNVSDLVVIDISNIANPVLVKRVKNAFPIIDQNYPPVSGSYFDCVDKSKGIVVGWESKTLQSPKCRR